MTFQRMIFKGELRLYLRGEMRKINAVSNLGNNVINKVPWRQLKVLGEFKGKTVIVYRRTKKDFQGTPKCVEFQSLQIGSNGMSVGVGIKGLGSCLIDLES